MLVAGGLWAALLALPAWAEGPGLGRPATIACAAALIAAALLASALAFLRLRLVFEAARGGGVRRLGPLLVALCVLVSVGGLGAAALLALLR